MSIRLPSGLFPSAFPTKAWMHFSRLQYMPHAPTVSFFLILSTDKHFTAVFDVYWTVHHCDNWRIKNQLDVTYYFIVLLIGSTCFGHYYAHHQELATIMLITTLVVSFLVCCRLEAGVVSGLQPGHYSSLTTPNLQPTANQERHDQCGKKDHSRELLMMGIVMPEACWANKKNV